MRIRWPPPERIDSFVPTSARLAPHRESISPAVESASAATATASRSAGPSFARSSCVRECKCFARGRAAKRERGRFLVNSGATRNSRWWEERKVGSIVSDGSIAAMARRGTDFPPANRLYSRTANTLSPRGDTAPFPFSALFGILFVIYLNRLPADILDRRRAVVKIAATPEKRSECGNPGVSIISGSARGRLKVSREVSYRDI